MTGVEFLVLVLQNFDSFNLNAFFHFFFIFFLPVVIHTHLVEKVPNYRRTNCNVVYVSYLGLFMNNYDLDKTLELKYYPSENSLFSQEMYRKILKLPTYSSLIKSGLSVVIT